MGATEALISFAVIVQVVTLKDKVNSVLLAIILNGMNALVISKI